ncbi:putative integral membrane protein linked to a cation pump [Thioflavicoccus mobilis 8321]|uniref:Putative integral membrane protein linked to a cation pump n=1 Tax=Thioflavicoccus mobilis 8321 TaxID=765912 RepID=L0GWD3_9GAMM|nr:FixH family protein [Thioflavicoccus mobilis]AGA90137.1 putative integral membrane protein linked to a cation pump [Thioflavicoccus mobilis 8321]
MNRRLVAAPDRPLPAWRSPWLVGALGLIAVVLAVNATMVYLAVKTNPGLVKHDYYERGRAYERNLASRLAADPGWAMQLDVPEGVQAGVPTTVRFVVVDRVGQPVTPEQVVFYAYRPADADRDFSVPMFEEGLGRYAAQVEFPLIGVWDTLAAASLGADEHLVGGRVRVERP